MNIKDYLHFYINAAQYRVRYVDYKVGQWTVWTMLTPKRYAQLIDDNSVVDVQLSLRPLESMTEEEKKRISFDSYQVLRNEHNDRRLPSRDLSCKWAAKQTTYLLNLGFDLFGLIPAGLAIDATTKTRISGRIQTRL